MQITFTVPGEPMGKERPRFGKGHTYTPEKTKTYEDAVRTAYKLSVVRNKFSGFSSSPVQMEITAYMPIPKSRSKRDKAAMAANELLPTVKPDWDNIGKIICDALNGMAYDDDKQVTLCTVAKRYAEIPCVKVMIKEDKPCLLQS